MRKSNQCIGLIFIILAMIGCDNDLVSEENKTFADFNWSETDTTRFELVVNDTTQAHSLRAQVRYNADFKYHNFYMTYWLLDSIGNTIDTQLVNFSLFDPITGKPLGDGFGSSYRSDYVLNESLTFPYTGKYELKLLQYMRESKLNGVESVGYRLERAATQ
ncbi:gliding motility lipoprotein GldH [Penaeicola halotolerans]|uniref:gliding motility lipoprotein GldH n=1 Tax=Penaeicola halotolerans TaxID=2793196 RepID=UPI001CF825D5|nr:gliding motility lipoprotein GldH [Penaeicola halotolerans]